MASKDTIDILNRKEFFYYDKPPKTPEIEKQDREQTKRDFALIRKDLEILDIFRKAYYRKELNAEDKPYYTYLQITFTEDEYNLLKEWLENDSRK